MSLVSVIVPVYNLEKYIKECVISLLNQSFKDFELIFVDDGSRDGTVEIIKSFNDKRIKVFKNDKKGAGLARNFGLSKALGKWVVFFDGDDFCNGKYLEKLVLCAENNEVDVAICGALEYSEKKKRFRKGKITHTLEYLDDEAKCFAKSFYEWCDIQAKGDKFGRSCGDMLLDLAEPWNKIYRREFLIQNKLEFASLPCSEDLPFAYSVLFCAKKISLIKENLVFIRKRPSSLSYSTNKNWINYFLAYEITDKIAFEYPYFDKIKEAYCDRKFRTYKYFYKKAGVLNFPYFLKFMNEIKRINDILKEQRYNVFKALF